MLNAGPSIESEFLKLVEVNRQRILRICRVYTWTPEDGEDLYQEIIFQIWRGLPGLREPLHANTWLYRVALNTAITFVRKNKSQRNVVPTGNEELRERVERNQHAVTGPDHNAQLEKLYEAMSRLNKVEKGLLTLYLEDLSYEEIARVMGMNANQVGVVLHRAKKKLSEWMKEVPA